MEAIVPVLVLTLIVVTFGSLLVYVSSMIGLRNQHYTKMKYTTYECGLPGIEADKTKISVRFYLTAILFIVFDIEIMFMYPWALIYKEFIAAGHGLYIFWSMFVFIALFLFGLVWEIRSKALEWD